ncbi:MAG TPA: SPOR domain-containing protein [Bryobacteraceae bacterium]|nr:SPOR domain-containing protein [Bryobacteraceae bacterium]
MITIGSPPQLEPQSGQAAEEPKRRVPFMAIPAILAVGLLLATGYVAARVIESRPHATAIVAHKTVAPVSSARQPDAAHVEALSKSPVEVHAASVPEPPEERPATVADASSPPPAEMVPENPAASAANLEPEAAGNNLDLISPQHGQRYLQIAAISARYTQQFLAQVSRYNVKASVAPGPNEDLVRVVIGPFADRETLAAAKAQIQVKWPDCFVRVY